MLSRFRPAIAALLLSALIGARAEAQQNQAKPKPQAAQEVTVEPDSAGFSAMMGPMMGQMMRVMMLTVIEIAAEPETAEKMATFSKNFFDALVRKGFTRQEALQIVMATGLPKFPGGAQ